jgi:hypothetical protein
VTLTDDELIEAGSALLECALAARAAARDKSVTAEQRERHASRAALLLAALAKLKDTRHAQAA